MPVSQTASTISLKVSGVSKSLPGVLHVDGGTQAVGEPNGPDDGENVINRPSSLYGEVFLQSAVFDWVRGYSYFGTDGYPGKIVKVLLPGSATGNEVCGDGIVQTGEECDDGSVNGQAGGLLFGELPVRLRGNAVRG